MSFKTDQENFWAGEFGKEYINRNTLTDETLAQSLGIWSSILRHCPSAINTVLELGSNIGINLHALKILLPSAQLTAVEINSSAVETLRKWGGAEVVEASLFDVTFEGTHDFVFTSGVLIHCNPDLLPQAYAVMAKASSRYVCIMEYYNPTPVSVIYRNNTEKLFKRDFAGEFLDLHPEFILREYGFVYHRDSKFPGGDLTWFLMEKV
ncbi:MAG: pseudaminic acid biosynthesis-associated methylase [Desulfovibrio sp.]|jgi:spore coat polysaccharide biosynthesis protein SpsF|nr:pseudaminic acid biosynthesis-associated methylase [Desulfovibrio sp.]